MPEETPEVKSAVERYKPMYLRTAAVKKLIKECGRRSNDATLKHIDLFVEQQIRAWCSEKSTKKLLELGSQTADEAPAEVSAAAE